MSLWVPGAWLRRFFWMHPEWWSLGLVALAWWTVVPPASTALGPVHHHLSFLGELLTWGQMVVAMMVPLMLAPLRWVAFQSFRYRRHRAILLFLLGFLGPWMLLGIGAAWLRTLDWSHTPLLASGLFGLATLWVLVPVRRQALVFCHRTVPLAPTGWAADRDCLRFSLRVGASCVATCGILMLACAATGHNFVAMLGGTVLGALEYRSFRPPTRPIVAGALLLAVLFFPYSA
jgi:hypothetical protein